MKKTILALLMAITSVGAYAQFDKGTDYVSASLSGLSMSYSKDAQFKFGLDVLGGHFIEDAWMLYGKFGWQHQAVKGNDNDKNDLGLGVGARYYIKQNGLYLACGVGYEHVSHAYAKETTTQVMGDDGLLHDYTTTKMVNRNYLDIVPEVGYCFYVNHYLSIEPSIYYKLCLNHFTEGSEVGLRVGLGFYF